MASEIQEGIAYSADIDASDFNKSLAEINKKLAETDKKAEQTGKKIDEALKPKPGNSTQPLDEVGKKMDEVGQKASGMGSKMTKVFEWLQNITGFSIAGILAGLVPIVVDFTKNLLFGEKALSGYAKGLDDFRKYSEEAAKAADDLKNKAADLISVIGDEASPKADQIMAFKELQTLYKGRLDDLTLESFKLKDNNEQWLKINNSVNAISLEKLKSDYQEAVDKAAELSTAVIELGDGTKSIRDNRMSDEFQEATGYAEQLHARILQIEEVNKLAAMTDRERLEYYKQQFEAVKMGVDSWEQSFGAIKRNNEGALEFKNNLALLSIAPLLGEYNNLLVKISTANKLLDPKNGLKSAKELQLKNINAEIDKLDKNNAADLKKRNELFKQRAAVTKELEWWNPDVLQRQADKAARISEAAAKREARQAEQAKKKQLQTIDELEAAHQTLTDGIETEGGKRVAAINKEYDALLKKAAQANLLGIKTKDGGITYGDQLKADRQSKIDAARYDEDTKKELQSLNYKKKLYQDYEQFKESVGKEYADRVYKNQIDTEKTFIQQVEELRKPLLDKQKSKTINNNELQRLQQYNKLVDDSNAHRLEQEAKWMENALTNYSGYQQKRLFIANYFEAERNRAIQKGETELLAGIDKAQKEALNRLDEENYKAVLDASHFFDGFILESKKAVEIQIKTLKQMLQNTALPDDVRRKFEAKLKSTEGLLNLNTPEDLSIAQIDEEIARVNAELMIMAANGTKSGAVWSDLWSQKNRLEMQKANVELEKINKKFALYREIASAVGELGGALESLADTNPKLAQLGAALTTTSRGLSTFLDLWEKTQNGTLTDADKFRAAADFIINAIKDIAKAAEENRLTEARYLQDVIEYQRGYNLALIEEKKIRSDLNSSIFHTDRSAKIKANLKEQIDLVNEYNQAMTDLQDGQVKVGTKKAKRDWSQVAASTGAGALIGAEIGGPWGAAIGGILGFGAGFLKKRQIIDVYDSLLKTYPDLIDAEGKLNQARAKSLLTSNLLDDKTRATLQYVTELQDQYNKAQEEINNSITELLGDLGNNIMNELVDDFKSGGKNAGDAFKKGFAKSLESLYADAIYSAILGPKLKKLQDDIEAGFKAGDDKAMEKSLYSFLDGYQEAAMTVEDMMKKAQEYAKSQGIDIWKTDPGGKSVNNLSGAYAQASQQSIDLLAGHTMGMRVAQLTTNDLLKTGFVSLNDIANRSLDNLQKIERNTYNTVDRLDSAVKELKGIRSKMGDDANKNRLTGI